ncbi:hypothetical protein OsI_30523 [Oryza sativa Indica Group]|uniref:Uncharacterized protein n=1 Tax=Oryza sativa subsp. indica TaxID=39946 RepID=B8BD84_ORYSI|nr:hypothetical protein OsI_30523 [Oryza sativa Indica Group]
MAIQSSSCSIYFLLYESSIKKNINNTIGSTEEYWCRQDAAQAIALVESFSLFSSTVYMFFVLDFQEELKVLWKGLGLDEGNTVGSWQGNSEKVLLGIGGGHYAPRHMDIVIARKKDTRRIKILLRNAHLPCSPNGSEVEDSGEDVIEDPFAAEASSSRADRGKAPMEEEEEEEEGDYAEESSEKDEDSDEDE